MVVDDAAIVEGHSVVRPEPGRLAVVFDCAVEPALAAECIASIVERLSVVGFELDRLIVILNGAVVVAFTKVCVAAIAERLGKIRCLLVSGLDERRAPVDTQIGIRILCSAPGPRCASQLLQFKDEAGREPYHRRRHKPLMFADDPLNPHRAAIMPLSHFRLGDGFHEFEEEGELGIYADPAPPRTETHEAQGRVIPITDQFR